MWKELGHWGCKFCPLRIAPHFMKDQAPGKHIQLLGCSAILRRGLNVKGSPISATPAHISGVKVCDSYRVEGCSFESNLSLINILHQLASTRSLVNGVYAMKKEVWAICILFKSHARLWRIWTVPCHCSHRVQESITFSVLLCNIKK